VTIPRFNTNLIVGPERATPLREIHEIEFTSQCNLRCRYCPHPKMQRAKADMTRETFDATMRHVQHYVDQGTQGEVSLTGIGETLMHPVFKPWARMVRQVIGKYRKLVLSTNGLLMTHDMAEFMASLDMHVYVSGHRPEKAGPAIELLKAAGCKVGANTAFMDNAIDWAGQVDWFVSTDAHMCAYLQKRWAAVRQDGSVNTCCMDAESLFPIGSVCDEVGSLRTWATKVCEGCSMVVPNEFREHGEYPPVLVDYLIERKRKQEAVA
jgi:hypothetical protein